MVTLPRESITGYTTFVEHPGTKRWCVCSSADVRDGGGAAEDLATLIKHKSLGGLRGFRPPGNSLEVGGIVSFETSPKSIAGCTLTFDDSVVLHRVFVLLCIASLSSVGTQNVKTLSFYVLLVNSVHFKEFLVQIHRVD